MAALGLVVLPSAAPARVFHALEEPARCVSEYLDAVAMAARPQLRGRGARPPAGPDEPRWARVRLYLTPRLRLELSDGRPHPLAPWSTLGRDGAFLGFELMAVRRAPRGAAVVVARERTTPAPAAPAVEAACAYLVGRVAGVWHLVDKRCGRDFSNAEVLSGYPGAWDEPPTVSARAYGDDAFPGDLE